MPRTKSTKRVRHYDLWPSKFLRVQSNRIPFVDSPGQCEKTTEETTIFQETGIIYNHQSSYRAHFAFVRSARWKDLRDDPSTAQPTGRPRRIHVPAYMTSQPRQGRCDAMVSSRLNRNPAGLAESMLPMLKHAHSVGPRQTSPSFVEINSKKEAKTSIFTSPEKSPENISGDCSGSRTVGRTAGLRTERFPRTLPQPEPREGSTLGQPGRSTTLTPL